MAKSPTPRASPLSIRDANGNPDRGRVESSPWAYGQGKGRKRGWESSCHGHTVSSPVDCHILPRKEGGFSVYVSNILKHSLEILGLPISGFPGYVERLCSLPHIQGYRIF